MVSVGSVLGLVLAGGAAVVGYALYQNREQIGGALSRGVQVSVTNPIGDWFENLFRSPNDDGSGEQNGASGPDTTGPPPVIPDDDPGPVDEFPPDEPNRNNDYIPCSNNPADSRTWCNDYTPPPEQDFMPRTAETSATRLANFNQNSRESILDRAEEIAAETGQNEGNALDTAILQSISYEGQASGNRFYDVFLNGEQVFNEYPLSPEAREYYLDLGYSVRTADGV